MLGGCSTTGMFCAFKSYFYASATATLFCTPPLQDSIPNFIDVKSHIYCGVFVYLKSKMHLIIPKATVINACLPFDSLVFISVTKRGLSTLPCPLSFQIAQQIVYDTTFWMACLSVPSSSYWKHALLWWVDFKSCYKFCILVQRFGKILVNIQEKHNKDLTERTQGHCCSLRLVLLLLMT